MRKSSGFLASLSVIYLLIPVVFFAWGWLRWPIALVTTLVAGATVAVAARDAWSAWKDKENRPTTRELLSALWPALVVVTAWLFASGIGGFGQQTGDYDSHNALLRGLIFEPWPLRMNIEGQTVNMVYYIGYYLPAAAFGKLFGWGAANIFHFLWAWLGVWLAFLWFWRICGVQGRRGKLLVLAFIFCLASGMDVIGYYLYFSNPFAWGQHIEVWAKLFQFSSQTSLLYWVPQQTLPAWLVAGLTFDCLKNPRTFRYLGMAAAACVLWSPFGSLGIVPYLVGVVIALLVMKQARTLFHPLSIALNLGSLWVGAVHILYISSNKLAFPIGLLWNLVEDRPAYLRTAFVFWALELAIIAVTAALLMRSIRRARREEADESDPGLRSQWGFFVTACVVLTVLPLFQMGYNNDLVMRSSIPSLFFLWAFTARALLDAKPYLRKRKVALPFALLLLFLVVGSYTSLSEIGRSIYSYHFGPPDLKDVKTVEDASYPYIVAQRIGKEDTFFYRYLGR